MALRFRRFQKGRFAASILTGHSGPVTAVLPGSAGTFVTAGKDEVRYCHAPLPHPAHKFLADGRHFAFGVKVK